MTKGNISKLRQTETERDKQRHSCICSKTKLVKHGTWRASFRFKLFSGDRNRGFFLRRTFGWDTALARWSALIISVLFGGNTRQVPSPLSFERQKCWGWLGLYCSEASRAMRQAAEVLSEEIEAGAQLRRAAARSRCAIGWHPI